MTRNDPPYLAGCAAHRTRVTPAQLMRVNDSQDLTKPTVKMTYLPDNFGGGEPNFMVTRAVRTDLTSPSAVDDLGGYLADQDLRVSITRQPPVAVDQPTRTAVTIDFRSTEAAVRYAWWVLGRYRVSLAVGTPLPMDEVERIADGVRIEA